MKVHPSLTVEVLMEAAQSRDTTLDNPGFCIKCGEMHHDCEPDARGYICEHCGEEEVYGAEEILMHLL